MWLPNLNVENRLLLFLSWLFLWRPCFVMRVFLIWGGEDWKIIRNSPVEDCVESEILPCLHGHESVCHRFTDAGGGHRIPGPETMGSSLIRAITVTRVSALTPVSKPVSLEWCKVGLKKTLELRDLKCLILGSKHVHPLPQRVALTLSYCTVGKLTFCFQAPPGDTLSSVWGCLFYKHPWKSCLEWRQFLGLLCSFSSCEHELSPNRSLDS